MPALIPSRFARLSQRLVAFFVARVWYRTRLHGAVPREGPTVFVALHRNGAVDGWVHLSAIGGDAVFLVAANLKRNPLIRLLAVGIPVERAKDKRDRSGNPAALQAAADWVAGGGRLVVYPEGTSTLGPAPLPFHPGAALIIARILERGVTPAVIPLGIDYERPQMPGTGVDIEVGEPLILADLPGSDRLIAGLQARIGAALTARAFLFADEASQTRARRHARLEAGGDGQRRLALLREGDVPHNLIQERLPSLWHRIVFCAGALANLPVALAAYAAPRRLADDRNVVAFWQIVPTILLAPLWLAISAIVAGLAFGPAGLLLPLAELLLGAAALAAAPKAFPARLDLRGAPAE